MPAYGQLNSSATVSRFAVDKGQISFLDLVALKGLTQSGMGHVVLGNDD